VNEKEKQAVSAGIAKFFYFQCIKLQNWVRPWFV